MRFGCCTNLDFVEAAAEADFDFVELSSAELRPERAESEFQEIRDRLRAASARPEVWDLRLPPGVTVCGPTVDWPRTSRFVNTAIRRMASAKGAVMAFTCGEACVIPQGFSEVEARIQVSDFLRVCAAVARSQGLVIGVEPGGCGHFIGSVPEAMALVRELNMPELGVLPNCRDMRGGNHSPLDIADAGAWLAHVHVSIDDLRAGPSGHFGEFIQALGLADYGGRVSVQGDWGGADELARARELLGECFELPGKGVDG
jgi:hypothetical protein